MVRRPDSPYPEQMSRLPTVAGLIAALGVASGCAAAPSAAPADAIASVEAGGLAGQGQTVASLRTGPGESLVTLELPGGSYTPTPPPGTTDDYRCFVLDLPPGTEGFATGFEVVPGNPDVTHHAIVYRVLPEQVAAAQKLEAADDRPGYECFGGSGLPSPQGVNLNESDWLTAWAPGGRASGTPEGYGIPVPADSKVVLQMHYNTRDGLAPDNTVVRMRMAVPDAQLDPLFSTLIPAPVELPCLPDQQGPLCDREAAVADVVARFGEDSMRAINGLPWLCGRGGAEVQPGPTQSCERTIREPSTLFAVAGHMHLLGRSITVDLNPGTPEEQRLLDVPNYDFDNQSSVPLPEPVDLQQGDKIRVTCTHDQSLRGLVPGIPEEPRYVVWGEGTTDEMCLAVLVSGKSGAAS